MKCPFCSFEDTKVIDSRLGKEGNNIRRRRECIDCGRRFTTYERVEEILPLVVKKDGRREPFDRLKIIAGMQRACEKRPVSIATIEKLVDQLEISLQESGEKEIDASRIGEGVMEALRNVDEVAYVRFASVYRQFKDINEFMAELKEILAKENKNA
ncbi:MAG: transcriptional regulator NrdR [Desulfuromonadales bacterium]|uniref:transcriptional regulator NrdR n=1 Tax=Desulfuromonas sp. KJ2020 TaxID=2919173 RepID=UPI0003239687|nr:transcriptional regulator NrdR [Desulfuromonas sp. KJ2020]MCP3177842.1 transcriptional regulator NrdR [Desulfuromonas sp. KJ2020]MDW7645732.1 transcriptional regulator NrdR [Desulfuromonadales bacterium]MDW7756512.1 transcriptional regulator NrdR [Desulfuromonadales bacterium]